MTANSCQSSNTARTVDTSTGDNDTGDSDNARTPRFTVGIVAVIGALLVAPIINSSLAPGTASASAASCPAVQVVFARGTGEPPGVGRVGDAFAEALRSQLVDETIAVYPVDYPASLDLLRAVEGASQGAAVMDIVAVADRPVLGFDNPLPPALADRVAAVAVFGNPSNRLRGPLTTLSPLYGEKTIDLCNGGDPVCSTGQETPAHSQYVQAGLAAEAARFVAGRL